MNINILGELAGLKGALRNCGDKADDRKKFLRQWFQLPQAREIASDPFVMGTFAWVADLTKEELGDWNLIYHGREDALEKE